MSKFFLDSIDYLKGVNKVQAIKEELRYLHSELDLYRKDEVLSERIKDDIEVLETFLESC